jgi:general secretion pathway protein M
MMAMNERERKLVIFGGGGLAIFVLLYFLLPAFFSAEETGTVGKQRDDLNAIMQLYKDFSNVRAEYQRIETAINSQSGFSILTELENLASTAEIKNNIESMESRTKPNNEYFRELAVDVRLVKITLKQLLQFLYSVEYSEKVLRVKKLHIEARYDNPDLLNAELEVSTFKPLE